MDCKDCSEQIPPARLRAVPEATRCVQCQRQYEKEVPLTPTFRAITALAVNGELTLHELFQ